MITLKKDFQFKKQTENRIQKALDDNKRLKYNFKEIAAVMVVTTLCQGIRQENSLLFNFPLELLVHIFNFIIETKSDDQKENEKLIIETANSADNKLPLRKKHEVERMIGLVYSNVVVSKNLNWQTFSENQRIFRAGPQNYSPLIFSANFLHMRCQATKPKMAIAIEEAENNNQPTTEVTSTRAHSMVQKFKSSFKR